MAYAYVAITNESRVLRAELASKLSAIARETIVDVAKMPPAEGKAEAPREDLPDVDVRWIEASTVAPNTDVTVERDHQLVLTRGFLDSTGRLAALEVSQSTEVIEANVRSTTLWTVALAAFIIVFASVYTMTTASRFVSVPIDYLIRQFRRVGSGDLAALGAVTRRDEFGKLAVELDAMIGQLADARAKVIHEHDARLTSLEQLRHADRLATVGRLASGIAHELGTPLNVISGYAKMIATGQELGADAADSARIIGEQSQRVTEIVRQLLDFARRGEPKLVTIDVRPIVGRALDLIRIEAEKRRVRVRYTEPSEALVANVDAARIQQVVVNLAINAIHASDAEGEIALELTRDGDDIALVVVDHGSGIAADALSHVFEPFFTTKPVGEGTGLGLAVSHGIVEEHGGRIEVASELGVGSRFTVVLRGMNAS
jgi:signal transduction histidine kinase